MLQTIVTSEVTAGLALLSDEEIEATATDAWVGLTDVGDVEDLVKMRGVEVIAERGLPDGFDGIALPHRLLVRPSRQRALWVLRVLHELAHHYLWPTQHTHADVWRLALALAWPLDRVRRGLRHLEIPTWSVTLRAAMLEESRVISAA